MLEVGHHEAHFQRAGGARYAALLNHAAQAKALPGLDLAGRNPARVEIEHHVLLEGAQRQSAGDADAGDNAQHPEQPPPPRSHEAVLTLAMRRRASAFARVNERSAQRIFRPNTAAVSA
jgi:hypothetical protein